MPGLMILFGRVEGLKACTASATVVLQAAPLLWKQCQNPAN